MHIVLAVSVRLYVCGREGGKERGRKGGREAGRSTGMEVRVICAFVINAVREIHTRTTQSSHGIHISLSPAGTNVYVCVCVVCVRLGREEQFEETTSIKQCARQTSTQESAHTHTHTNEQEREACERHKEQ
jgi:hypothetical protein